MRTYLSAVLGVFVLTATAWGSDKSAPPEDATPSRVGLPNLNETNLPRDPSSIRTETPTADGSRRLGACVLAAKDTGVTVSNSGDLNGAKPPKITYHAPPQIIEAEALLAAGKVQVSGGELAVQPMTGFGPGWGGGAQLFWSGGGAGAVLDATINANKAGIYNVYLHLTKAPDFGAVKTQVRGLLPYWKTGKSMDGWSPSVEPPFGGYGDLVTENFRLAQGDNHLSLMITGKNEESSGYLIGIDCIVLDYVHS